MSLITILSMWVPQPIEGCFLWMKIRGFVVDMMDALSLSMNLCSPSYVITFLSMNLKLACWTIFFLRLRSYIQWGGHLLKFPNTSVNIRGVSLSWHYCFISSKFKMWTYLVFSPWDNTSCTNMRLIPIAWIILRITFSWLLSWMKRLLQIRCRFG